MELFIIVKFTVFLMLLLVVALSQHHNQYITAYVLASDASPVPLLCSITLLSSVLLSWHHHQCISSYLSAFNTSHSRGSVVRCFTTRRLIILGAHIKSLDMPGHCTACRPPPWNTQHNQLMGVCLVVSQCLLLQAQSPVRKDQML